MKILQRLNTIVRHRLNGLLTVRRRFIDAETRLGYLEKSFDKLLESPKYVAFESFRYVPADSVGFNGQQGRKRMFAEIVDAVQFGALVETGTLFGDTAAFMHETTKLPVFTCESNRHFWMMAKIRLAEFPGIIIEQNDSRRFLISLGNHTLEGEAVFFYLDAHWYVDIPLRDEIQIIGENWKDFVIMIDDFKVPGDEGYRYERSGAGHYFMLDGIKDQLRMFELRAYFPSLHSSEETGWRAGSVVITRRGPLSETLSRLSSLRQAIGAPPSEEVRNLKRRPQDPGSR